MVESLIEQENTWRAMEKSTPTARTYVYFDRKIHIRYILFNYKPHR